MQRNALEELARNPAFIPFVYDYCDQCCQECRASPRCLVYQIEQRCSLDEPADDGRWPDGREVALLVARTSPSAVAALDVELCDPSAPAIEQVIGDPLEALARRYAIQLAGFLRSVDPAMSEEPNDAFADALTMAAWFQMIIPEKICRALISARRAAAGTPELRGDALGCARLVLVGIRQSRAALLEVRALSPRVDALVEVLETLSGAVEQRFPEAWSFMRPGLDASTCSEPSV